MKRLYIAIAGIIAVCFISRFSFWASAEFGTKFWVELYWFIHWFIYISWPILIRAFALSQKWYKLAKALLRVGILFATLFLWEILNCYNTTLAQSETVTYIMLGITTSIIVWTIFSIRK